MLAFVGRRGGGRFIPDFVETTGSCGASPETTDRCVRRVPIFHRQLDPTYLRTTYFGLVVDRCLLLELWWSCECASCFVALAQPASGHKQSFDVAGADFGASANSA